MNKNTINTIAGIGLIFAIFIAYFLITAPSKEERLAKRRTDSIRVTRYLDSLKILEAQKIQDSFAAINQKTITDSLKSTGTAVIGDTVNGGDSLRTDGSSAMAGPFLKASGQKNKYYILENELVKLRISSRGGFVSSVELKKYLTYDKKPLILFDNDSAFKVNFYGNNNVLFQTSDFVFESFTDNPRLNGKDSIFVNPGDSVVFGMRLYPGASDTLPSGDKYIEFSYTLRGNDYMIGFSVNFVNMQQVLASNAGSLYFEWAETLHQQEKSLENEQKVTTIYYKLLKDDVDYLSETADDEEEFKVPLKWISFKQQFFSATLIAEESFKEAKLKVVTITDTAGHNRDLKNLYALMTVPYVPDATSSYPMSLYFGPNHYKTLTAYNLELERQIPLGWSFFLLQWINRGAVIPIFNWLESYGVNYGIIILILTVILKVILFPIAYKTYKSSAKMRVLKPEIEEIGKKFPKKEDSLKKQQATMALYKKAGVNPMAGCIPLLLQMPILIALFRFFPASIELRQQSFLWADDLSSYDAIASWTPYIWGLSDVYGNHISLFTLLMTISTVIYTWLNNQLMGQANQMPAMKWMMYLMPIMFLGFFNNFAAGLSYYYLLANLITFLQMWIFRMIINEDKLHAQIQESKKKPVKKSKFQAKLEDMAKQRGYNPSKK